MAFTTNSPVRSVYINLNEAGNDIDGVGWEWWDGTAWNSESFGGGFTLPATEPAALQTLQQIWASDDGLKDNNDAVVVPQIYDANAETGITTLADLIRRGFRNPLDPDGYEKWRTGRYVGGLFNEFGEVTHKQPLYNAPDKIEFEGSFVPRTRRGEPGRVWRENWIAGVNRNNYFLLTLDIPEYQHITPDELDDYAPIVQMRQLLNRLKKDNTQADVGTDANDPMSWRNRLWLCPNPDDPTMTSFQFGVIGLAHHLTAQESAGGVYTRFVMDCATSGTFGGYNQEHMAAQLVGYEVITAAVDTEVEFGDRETPLNADRINLSDKVLLRGTRNGLDIGVKDRGKNTRFWVPYGAHRIIDHENLETETLGNGRVVRVNPLQIDNPHVGEIHYRGTTAPTSGFWDALRIRDPIASTDFDGIVLPLIVDNQGANQYDILDWDGNELVHLQPGESATLRFIADLEGGGRVIVDAPPRILAALTGDAGTLGGTGYYNFDTHNFARYMPFVTTSRFDRDAYDIGTEANVPSNLAWSAANLIHNQRTVRMETPGTLQFVQRCELLLTGTTSGTIPAGHRTSLYRKRGVNILRVDDSVINQALTPSFPGRQFSWEYSGVVEEGDIFAPLWIFAKSTSYGTGNITVGDFALEAILHPQIVREYTRPTPAAA